MNRRDLIDALKAEDFSPYYRLADKIRFQEKGKSKLCGYPGDPGVFEYLPSKMRLLRTKL